MSNPIQGNALAYASSIDGVKQNLTELNAQIQQKKSDYDKFKGDISGLISQISNAIKELKRNLESLNRDKSNVDSQIRTLTQQLNELKPQLEQAKSELETLRTQKATDDASSADLNQRYEASQRQIEELNTAKSAAEDQLRQLQSGRDDIDRQLEEVNRQINEIRTIVTSLDPSADPNGNIIQQLQQILGSLNNNGSDSGQGQGDITNTPQTSPLLQQIDANNPQQQIIPQASRTQRNPRTQNTISQGRFGEYSNPGSTLYNLSNPSNAGPRRGGKTKKRHRAKKVKHNGKSRSRSRKQRGGFIAFFKQKTQTHTPSSATKKKTKKNKKDKKDKKYKKRTTSPQPAANDPYNF